MPDKHLKYGGSSMKRTLNCGGWAKLAETVPHIETGSEAAELGTCLHDAIEWIIANGVGPDHALGMKFNDIKITDDMIVDSLCPAYEAIQSIIKKYELQTIKLEPFVQLIEDLAGGSIDFIGLSRDRKTMVIADYKFGFYAVPAEQNAQLLFYALCADVDEHTAELFKDVHTLSLNIIQPSNSNLENGLDEWAVPVDILDDFEDDVAKAIKANEAGSDVNAGGWCKFCPAEAVCPIKTGEAQKANKLPTVHVEMIEEWLPRLDDLESWIAAVKIMASDALHNGTKIEGYKLVNKRATRQWADPAVVEDKIKKMRGISGGIQYDQKLKSPAQMEKLFKREGVDFDKVSDYIVSVSSGTTMAKASDKREEALPVNAMKDIMKAMLKRLD